MLSKEAKLRIKINHTRRVLRHAIKLAKKENPDFEALTRTIFRLKRGKVVDWLQVLKEVAEENKVQIISKVGAKDGEFLQTFRARLGQIQKEDRTLWFSETNPLPKRLLHEPEPLLVHLGLSRSQLL